MSPFTRGMSKGQGDFVSRDGQILFFLDSL